MFKKRATLLPGLKPRGAGFQDPIKHLLRQKHRILMRCVLSADKTPYSNKEEVYR